MPVSLISLAPSPFPELTLRVDHTGTAFGAAPTWTDYSAKLLLAGDGSPIQITRLRQDENSEVTPSSCSFVLDNTDGSVTPGNAAAPAGWDVGARVGVRLTVDGTTYDRFDGYIDVIEPAYPGQSWSLVRVSCTDITARLAVGSPLRSMVEQEMLEDSPSYLYPLDEPDPSPSAGDVSSNHRAAAIRVDGKYGPGGLAFGSEMAGLAETTSGVSFGPYAAYPSGMSVLSITNSGNSDLLVPAAGAHSQECWFIAPTALPAFATYLLDQVGDIQSPRASLIALNTGAIWYALTDADVTVGVSATGTTNLFDGKLHHAVGTLNADRRTVKLYIDGQLVDSSIAARALSFTGLRYNQVGGHITPSSGSGQFPGTIAKVAIYTTELSAARILAHYQAGIGTLTERSDLRYSRLAGYANLTTTGLPAGFATCGAQNTAGKSVTEALAQVARTEGTVSYATGAGALTFQARTARYDAVAAVTLTASDIPPETTTRRDRQGMANQFTVTRNGGASQRFVDTTRQTADGMFDGGSLDVASSTDDDALQNAAWQVGTRKSPRNRLPDVTVNLLAMDDVAKIKALLAADIGTLMTITSLPSQAPASSMSVFIEGWTEQIGMRDWSISPFTSPNLPAVWKVTAADDPYSALDGTMLVGF